MTRDGTRDDSLEPLEDRTRQMTSSPSFSASPRSLLLERIEPSLGRGERIRLDTSRDRFRLGRAEHNEIRLYTASASREHAVIEARGGGEWVLTPVAGKAVGVDGELQTMPVILEVGLNLVMGGDHLRCVNEELTGSLRASHTSIEESHGGAGLSVRSGWTGKMTPFWWGVSALAISGLALVLFALFAG